jgi:endonuclease G
MPITAEEINKEIVNEVVLGTRDFLSVEFLERGVVAARSIGRVLIQSGGDLRARGTGFLVASGLLLTNEHVLTSPELAARCALEMDYEQNRFGPPKQQQVFRLDPERFFLNDGELDYALVAVAPTSDRGVPLTSYGWLPLNGAQGKISISDKDYLNIVQHPLGREKEVVIRNNRVLDMRTATEEAAEKLGAFLHYEADTEKGSSGSAVMNDGWEVVGLHHSGVPATDEAGNWLDKDGHIWREGEQPVERIQWVANEALRVSSLVAALAIANLDPGKRALLKEAFSAQAPLALGERTLAEESLAGAATRTPRTPPEAPQPARRTPARREAPATGGTAAVIEVPLRISITLGEVSSAPTVIAARTSPATELLLERLEPEDFADRDGYDREFLGVSLPLPKLKAGPRFGGALVVPRPARAGDRTELRYHNYSIVMCGKRRLAYVSACNLNFAAPETAGRKDGRKTWRMDPRLDPVHQLADKFYDHNDYDKGHLTRRDDVAWGETLLAAIAANDDTFFYTNAAPQHFLFNQSDDFTQAGLDLWGDLENHISEQGAAQRTRLTIFNGPIFGERDKPLHDALVPLKFYKIVIWKDEGEDPAAVGFLLDQADLVATLPEEAIDPGRFEIRQRRIAEIEAELDIDFGKVKSWDRLAAPDAEEAIGTDGIPIMSLADIRL